MNVKQVCASCLVVAFLGFGAVRGQDGGGYGSAPSPSVPPGDVDGSHPPAPAGIPGLSDWIVYRRGPACCGPIGGHGPIAFETYIRSGPSFQVGGGVLADVLRTGWNIQGGGRSLFFNPEQTAAWTIDASISNIYNNSSNPAQPVTLLNVPDRREVVLGSGQSVNVIVPRVNVGVTSLNRTFVNLAGGREWYLWGSADCDDVAWRVGADVGGRWGSAKCETTQFRHRTDAIGGAFAALHSDVECPCGGCLWQAGVRVEWSYTWSDILQRQNDSDLQELNVLFSAGLRF